MLQMKDTELQDRFDTWIKNEKIQPEDDSSCMAHIISSDDYGEGMSAVTVSHNCIDYLLSLQVVMKQSDYNLIKVVSGKDVIEASELNDLCEIDSDVFKCEFEVGEANMTLGILYGEGYSNSNMYNGIWSYF